MPKPIQYLDEPELFKSVYNCLLKKAALNEWEDIFVFPAGKFTRRLISSVEGKEINAILDDFAEGPYSIDQVKVLNSNSISAKERSVILISSDSIEEKLLDICKAKFPLANLVTVSSLAKEARVDYKRNRNSSDNTPTIWQKAYEIWQKGNQCPDFKDCMLLAVIISSSGHYRERDYEYGFTRKHLSINRGKVLDIGSSLQNIPRELASRGCEVTCIDPNIEDGIDGTINNVKGDIRSTDWPDNTFDAITCISTIEHIGLPGRYGITENDPDGDHKSIIEMHRILKPGGLMVLTVPIGSYAILPINKVYTHQKILSMCEGFKIVKSNFWAPDGFGGCYECDFEEASENDWRRDGYYALGCYLMEKL